MRFKLIIALVEDSETNAVLEAARKAGATGSTVINQARGEGVKQAKTFFGLTLETQRDMVLLMVEEHLSRTILERIAEAGHFDERPGTGIAFQLNIEDAVGVSHQIQTLAQVIEEEI
ncbi:nitrogen regulatory protein P-II [Candidatus Endoriftia persephone str. Guaymas]|jgi:nitrogen regulatory protein PII|uniref:P-II family nitrogen regulator n=4 Tax=Gammaproteobacteria TaxID=1236 RepID=A0A9J6ZWQ2_9GAMM|nr:P-II family nitrogen regulator [Candidatus Endoriftia persephone]MBA1332813.1 nitrogen regulatory protein P-II [Candidatus Endoriftia persephone str. Guaymas]EGW54775.1 putative nitrogen regulatory protein P-II [endosymbiont of Tevnia jerichonana (vent Tica)]KRT55062.1 nitrogen regulatory protein P-II family [endosymbiont of Ridgeia piscesae]KRT60208.1 nitrogen regulatory protein P-II family [endosymbiont of Ridgeia piscesae]USF87294.1 P-II family nitrogen regulator [Candidatus Endoriftia p